MLVYSVNSTIDAIYMVNIACKQYCSKINVGKDIKNKYKYYVNVCHVSKLTLQIFNTDINV